MLSDVRMVLKLMRRELRGGLRGFGVFLLCLFLGVFAISAVGSFTDAARKGLLADAGALLGGDLEIRMAHQRLPRQKLEELEAYGRLSRVAQMRTMAATLERERSALVELKAVDEAYPLYGELLIAPPQPRKTAFVFREGGYGALAEQALLDRLGLGVGDHLRVGDALFRIRGVLTLEPDRNIRGFSLGPRLLVDMAGIEATKLIRPGSLVNYEYRLRLADRNEAQALKERIQEENPQAGWRIRTWENANPRVRFFLDRMDTNLSLIGLCSLLVGGLGISGAVRGYLSDKLSHIATLKAVGGCARLVFAAYLGQILLLGGLGTALGLAAGAALPFALSELIQGQFPIPLQPGISAPALLKPALFGLLIVLIFSLKALGAACRVEPAVLFRGYLEAPARPTWAVTAAIVLCTLALALLALLASPDRRVAAGFILGAGLCFGLFRWLSSLLVRTARRLPRPSRPRLRLALSNIQRPGSPAASILFALGLGLTALVSISLVEANLQTMVQKTVPRDAPSFFFLDIQPHQLEELRALLDTEAPTHPLQSYPTLRGRILAINGVEVERAEIDRDVQWAVRGDRFLSYSEKPPQGTRILKGDWWQGTPQDGPKLSLTADLAEGFGVDIGDSLTVSVLGREISARIANLREVDWSSLQLNFALLFSPGVLEDAPQTHIGTIRVEQAQETAVFRAVSSRFPNVSIISIREVLTNVSRTMDRIGGAFTAMSLLALASGFLVLAAAIGADQHRRIQDAVIFKVCGATSTDSLVAFACEFLLLGLCAGLVATLAGSLCALAILKGPMDVPWSFHPGIVLSTLGTAMLMCLVLGLAGTWKALRKKPAEYLRNE